MADSALTLLIEEHTPNAAQENSRSRHGVGFRTQPARPLRSRAIGKTAHFADRKGLSRIMYVERQVRRCPFRRQVLSIGRVTFSKNCRSTIYYRGRWPFVPSEGGYKSNYRRSFRAEKQYWISGPKRNGADRLYGERVRLSKSMRTCATNIGARFRRSAGIQERRKPWPELTARIAGG